MAVMRLDEALEKIIEAFELKLQAAIVPGGLLEDVVQINLGDRTRDPQEPSVWIFGQEATCSSQRMANGEVWEFPVTLVSVFRSEEPVEGYKAATRLAARARSVILKDRTLGLREFVQDTKSQGFMSSSPEVSGDGLYGAGATVLVTFSIREP